MSGIAYPACVRELYDSEIMGEALALGLFEVARDDLERYHFGTLLQLETETKARLRPLLAKYGMTLSEKIDLSRVGNSVTAFLECTRQQFTAAANPGIKRNVQRFQEIADAGPQEDKAILESMVRHEEAILRWNEMLLRDQVQGSLDHMIAQLQYPLPLPAITRQ